MLGFFLFILLGAQTPSTNIIDLRDMNRFPLAMESEDYPWQGNEEWFIFKCQCDSDLDCVLYCGADPLNVLD